VAEEKPDLHSFICDGKYLVFVINSVILALGIKYEVNSDDRGVDLNKFNMKHEQPPELWHPCKDIDIGSQYTTHQMKRGENKRNNFKFMKHADKNSNLQKVLLADVKTTQHESNLPIILNKNYYEQKDKLSQPILSHMQKRFENNQRG
jgi:hypothetical protein